VSTTVYSSPAFESITTTGSPGGRVNSALSSRWASKTMITPSTPCSLSRLKAPDTCSSVASTTGISITE